MAGSGGLYQNKNEAMREKDNAEMMIIDRDYAGARDRLRKAHSLFPVDDIVPMLTVCDILSASTTRFPGLDIDYYWILRLTPESTMSDVRLSHRKLVSLLRPLTNRFPGTELALKLIRDAFTVLSDNDSRSEFISHRSNVWADFPLNGVGAPVSHSATDMEVGVSDEVPFQGQSSGKTSLADINLRSTCINIGPRVLSNQEATSSSSSKNSKGKEIETNSDVNTTQHDIILEQQQTCLEGADHEMLNQDFYDFDDDRKISDLKPGQIWAVHHQLSGPQNRRYAQIVTNDESTVNILWLKPIPVGDGERRWCEAGLPVACGSFCLDLELREEMSSPLIFSHKCTWSPGLTIDQFDIYPKEGEVWALYEDWNIDEWSSDVAASKNCHYKMVEIICDFSKYTGVDCACLVKVEGFRSIFERETEEGNPIIIHISPGMLYMLSHKVPVYRFTGKEKDGVTNGMLDLDCLALSDHKIEKLPEQIMSKMEDMENSSSIAVDEDNSHTNPILEKDLFGHNQLLNFTATGQLWAMYCGRDSMPRQYVMIDDVIGQTHARVTFLEHEPYSELEINWKKKNLPVSCGFYKVGGTTVRIEMSELSHPIKYQIASSRPSDVIVYPMKGEVWAMYQDWKPNWERSNYESCEYSILEVISDLSEGDRIVVARLANVGGYLTFFDKSQLNGYELTREVSRKDILSFSHKIPCYKVPGIGAHGIPESSWHLDPNALPPRRRRSSTIT